MTKSAHASTHHVRPDCLTRSWSRLKGALLATMFVLQKEHHEFGPHASVLALVLKTTQLTSFAFAAGGSYLMMPLAVLSGASTIEWYFRWMSPAVYFALLGLAFAWTAMFLILSFWIGLIFEAGSVAPIWSIRLLRLIGKASAGLLFIPLFSMLISPLWVCSAAAATHAGGAHSRLLSAATASDALSLAATSASSTSVLMGHVGVPAWAESGITCGHAGHVAVAALTSLAGLVFLFLACVFTAVLVDTHPLSANLSAKSCGRLDLAVLTMEAVLVLVHMVAGSNQGLVTAANVTAGLVWLCSVLWIMPFNSRAFNASHAACACVYLLATVAVALQEGMPAGAFDGALMFYACALPVAEAGAHLVRRRHTWIMSAPLQALRSPYDWHHRVRSMLQTATHDAMQHTRDGGAGVGGGSRELAMGQSTGASAPPGSSPPTNAAMPSFRNMMPSRGDSSRSLGGGAQSAPSANLGNVLFPHQVGVNPLGYAINTVDDAIAHITMPVNLHHMDIQQREETVRSVIPRRVLSDADCFYKLATQRFGRSSMLHSLWATFSAVYSGNTKAQLSRLIQALRLKPELDVEFAAYRARKQRETSAGHESLLARIAFDKHMAEAHKAAKHLGVAQSAFFGKLLEHSPSLSELHSIAARITNESRAAETALARLAVLNPTSISYLRLHSTYCCLANDMERAATLAAEADRLEEAKAREHQTNGDDKDHVPSSSSGDSSFSTPPLLQEVSPEIMCDAQASLDVSANTRAVGMILGVNSAAVRLLGYPSKSAVERRSINLLQPTCVAAIHDQMLAHVIETGISGFVDAPRLLLIKHRQGFVVPCYVVTREMIPEHSNAEGYYNVVVKPAVSTEHFFIVNAALTLQEGSQGSLAMLGMDPSAFKAAELRLQDLIKDDLDAMYNLLMRPNGAVVTFATHPRRQSYYSAKDGDDAASSEGDSRGVAKPSTSFAEAGSGGDNSTMQVRARLQILNRGLLRMGILSWRPLSVAAAQQQQPPRLRSSMRDIPHPAPTDGGGGAGAPAGLVSGGFHAPSALRAPSPSAGGGYPSGHVAFKATPVVYSAASPDDGTAYDDDGDDESGGDDSSSAGERGGGGGRGGSVSSEHVGFSPRSGASSGDEQQQRHPFAAGARSPPLKRYAAAAGGRSAHLGELPALPAHSHSSEDIDVARRGTGGGSGGGGGSRSSADREARALSFSKGHAEEEEEEQDRDQHDRDERSSYTSGSSAYSRKMGMRLRRSLLESNEAAPTGVLDVGFRPLRTLLFLSLVVVFISAALGLVATVVVDRAFEKNQVLLKFSSASRLTSEANQQVARMALERALWLGGWLQSTDLEEQQYNTAYAGLQSQQFSSSLVDMAELSAASGDSSSHFSAEDVPQYTFLVTITVPRTNVTDADMARMLAGHDLHPYNDYHGNTVIGTVDHVSLYELGRKLGSRFLAWSQQNISSTHFDNTWTRFIIENSASSSPVSSKIRSLIFLAADYLERSAVELKFLVFVISMAMGPGMCTLCGLLMIRAIWHVQHSRDRILLAFFDLPPLVVAQLKAIIDKRLKALRDGDDDDDEMDEIDDGEEEHPQRFMAPGGGDDGHGGDATDDADFTDWTTVYARVEVEAARTRKHAIHHARTKRAASTPTLSAAPTPAMAAAPTVSSLLARMYWWCSWQRDGVQQLPPTPPSLSAADGGRAQPPPSHRHLSRGRRAGARDASLALSTPASVEIGAEGGTGELGSGAGLLSPSTRKAAFASHVTGGGGAGAAKGGPPAFRPARTALLKLVLFLTPLVIVTGFFLGLWLSADDTLVTLNELAKLSTLASLRLSTLRAISMATMTLLASVGHPTNLVNEQRAFRDAALLLRAVDSQLVAGVVAKASDVIEGGETPPAIPFDTLSCETRGVRGLGPVERAHTTQLLFGNLCRSLTRLDSDRTVDVRLCEALFDGRLKRGAATALRDYVDAARALVARRAAVTITNHSDVSGFITLDPKLQLGDLTGGDTALEAATLGATVAPWSLAGELGSKHFVSLTALRRHLAPAYNEIADVYTRSARELAEGYQQVLRIYVSIVFAVLLLGMLYVYVPAIKRLDRDIRHEQSLLLLLPFPVLQATPGAKLMIAEILRDRGMTDLSAGAPGAGGGRG